MKLFHCTHCQQRVFFDNLRCEACGSTLGFVPDERQMIAFEVDEATSAWKRLGLEGRPQRPCGNYVDQGVCNWMLDADDPCALCLSCRTTQVIPALGKPENRLYWALLEQAKRRLFYTLFGLKLPAPNRDADPENGVSFQFLEDLGAGQRVLTGHDDGLITLNIAEADDSLRERMRAEMHEPYRTLIGHFRHEIGHYYWDRLVRDTPWIDEYRALFGDERDDYQAALERHYASPVVDWQDRYISLYASSHPWEDWAESWAHYLHMIDGLETAAAWGLRLDFATPGRPPMQASPVDLDAPTIAASLIEQWLPVSQFSNAMNRSLGLPDSYPFLVPAPVIAKLDFIHKVVGAAVRGESPMNFAPLAPVLAPALEADPAETDAPAAKQGVPPRRESGADPAVEPGAEPAAEPHLAETPPPQAEPA